MSKVAQFVSPGATLRTDTAGDEAEVWVTARVRFDSAALADYVASGSGDFIGIYSSGEDFFDSINIVDDSGPVWAGLSGSGPTPVPTADAWHLLELHFDSSGDDEIYVDGALVASGSAAASGDARRFRFGGYDFLLDYVKAGTARGGFDLFSDSFEDGTLDAFDEVVNAENVEVVDDPDAPAIQGLCVALGDTALEPDPNWVRLDDPDDVSLGSLVQSIDIKRGKGSERDKNEPGTIEVQIIDRNGVLDPTNTDGIFFGTIDPVRQIAYALRNPVTGDWTTIFRGHVTDWEYELDIGEGFFRLRIEGADAFDLFAALEMTPEHFGDTVPAGSEGDIYFPEEQVDDRINQALDDAGWPAGLRSIFSGNVLVQGTVYARRDSLLQVLLETADAEFPNVANIFMSKNGWVFFRGRFARFNPDDVSYDIDTWQVGDRAAYAADTDVVPLAGLAFRRSSRDIINASLALPNGVDDTDVPAALVKDDTSIDTYGWRSDEGMFPDLLVQEGDESPTPFTAVEETKLYATYTVANYKDPKTRIDQLTFRPLPVGHPNAAALWAMLCGVELSDIVHPTTTHPGGGGFDEDCFVEGLEYEIRPMGRGIHEVTLRAEVSPRSFYDSNPFD